jgi:hypothetical protein
MQGVASRFRSILWTLSHVERMAVIYRTQGQVSLVNALKGRYPVSWMPALCRCLLLDDRQEHPFRLGGLHVNNIIVNPLFVKDLFDGGLKAAWSTGNDLRLYQNTTPIDPNDPTLFQFTEATFDGYAAVVTPFGAPLIIRDPATGGWQMVDAQRIFTMTGTTTPNNIYGAYITSGGNWLVAWSFAAPYPMVDTSSSLIFTPLATAGPAPLGGDVEPVG